MPSIIETDEVVGLLREHLYPAGEDEQVFTLCGQGIRGWKYPGAKRRGSTAETRKVVRCMACAAREPTPPLGHRPHKWVCEGGDWPGSWRYKPALVNGNGELTPELFRNMVEMVSEPFTGREDQHPRADGPSGRSMAVVHGVNWDDGGHVSVRYEVGVEPDLASQGVTDSPALPDDTDDVPF